MENSKKSELHTKLVPLQISKYKSQEYKREAKTAGL